LKRPVQDITRYTREIEDLTREISRYESQLGESGGALSGAEIRAKIDSLNEQRVKLQREQKGVISEKEKARIRIQGFKDQISSMRLRLGEGENKIASKNGLMRDLNEAKAQLASVQEDIQVRHRDIVNTRLRQRKRIPLNLISHESTNNSDYYENKCNPTKTKPTPKSSKYKTVSTNSTMSTTT
jgi:chromosome segregation ATPase